MREILKNIPFKLDRELLMDDLRIFPNTEEAADFESLIRKVEKVANPKALYIVSFVEAKGEDTVRMDGISFTSRVLRKNLEEVERVFPFVATCGEELDLIQIPEDDFIKAYWLDVIKVAILEVAGEYLIDRLMKRFALKKVSTMSPGSGDLDVWPIEQQKQLFRILGNTQGDIGVRLTDSCVMIPTKSISGICFPTERDFRSCQLCHRENCPSRSASFDEELWKMFNRD